MALTEQSRGQGWSRWHLAFRMLGLTGLLAAAVGVVLLSLDVDLSSWQTAWQAVRSQLDQGAPELGAGLLLGGGLVALLALLIEVIVALRQVAGRRSAFGGNVALQIALALVLLVGVNVYSYRHYLRIDWTYDHRFTLPEDVRDKLSKLRGQTTIVVYQRHKTFGQLSDKPDAYDYAAERKVVEKVKDLVEQFRELGPQFKVVVLDVEEEGFNDKLAELTTNAKELGDAIDKAPENSIFFYGGDKVQRLSFNDFYQLDKTASQEAGNLVLLAQGVEPFADNVLYIDQKRPRIAVGVIHEILSTEGESEELSMPGVRKTLAAHGFDVRDLVLKKGWDMGTPEPTVLTFDESKYERLEAQRDDLREEVKSIEKELPLFQKLIKEWKEKPIEELKKTAFAKQNRLQDRLDEEIRQEVVKALEPGLTLRQLILEQNRKELESVEKEMSAVNVDNLAEQRRLSDVRAKASRQLADCDLLIIPQPTLFNVTRGDRRIPNRLYQLDDAQVRAIEDFLKAGKPILACFGPANEPSERMMMDPMAGGPSKLEKALEKLGIKFGNQTVLFNVESKAFAERRGGLLIQGANVEVPPVEFDWQPGAGLPPSVALKRPPEKPNEIRESMRLAARSLGKDQPLELRLRHPRPVYYDPPDGEQPEHEPEFMMANAASWNENTPFATRERTPRYEPPSASDPATGTLDEKRRGPFPIGVAVKATLPASWYTDKNAKPGKVRVAAIGQGGVFIGPTLSPAKEKLFLDLCNWLLGRDDLLTKNNPQEQFLRVPLTTEQFRLWEWGMRLGLPVLFAYLGLMVLMVRRLR